MLGTGGYRDVAAVRQRYHAQGIFQSLLGGDVAGDDRDGAHIEFRRVQRQHQGHGIVRAGIGVDDDLLRGAERGEG